MALYQEELTVNAGVDVVKPLLVLGMHRSGTSAVAGALTMLGAAAPKTLMPATQFNERGHWESDALMGFNERLLRSAGSAWDDWRAFNPGWYQAGEVERFKREASDLIRAEFEERSLIVVKDPRVCRFAPFWLDVLADMAAAPTAVIPVRSPLEVAHSLKRRDGFPITKGVLLWLRHVLDAERATRGSSRVVFAWNSFLKDWRHTAEGIAQGMGVSWPSLSDYSAQKIDEFLSSELRHEAVPDSRLRTHPEVDEWARRAYEAMLTLANEPDSEAAYSTLDEVQVGFERACKLFGRVALDHERALTEQQAAYSLLNVDRDRWLARSEDLEGELAGRNQEIAQFVDGLSQVKSERDELEAALAAAAQANTIKVAEFEAELAAKAAGVAELEIELAAARARTTRVAELEAALAFAQATADAVPDLETALARLASERNSTLADLAAFSLAAVRAQEKLSYRRDVLRWHLSLSQELAAEVRKVRRQPWRPLAQRILWYLLSTLAFPFSAFGAPGRIGQFFQRQADQRTPRRLGALANDADSVMERLLAFEAEGDRLSPAGAERRSLVDDDRIPRPDAGVLEDLCAVGYEVGFIPMDGDFEANFYAKMYPEVVAAGHRAIILQLKEDARLIREANILNADYYPASRSNEQRTFEYIRAWAREGERRKPFPGFHPGIYQETHGVAVAGGDPLGDYLRAGRPKGPWRAPVILPSQEALPVQGQRVALHIHAFYPDDVAAIMSALGPTRAQIDLLVSVVDEGGRERVSEILKPYRRGAVDIRITPNRGRDLGSFCTGFADTIQREYDLIGHVHTKRTPHYDPLVIRQWVEFLFVNLLGGEGRPSMADRILGTMAAEPTIGLVFPDDPNIYSWMANRTFAEDLARRMGMATLPENIVFPVGTMFWARVAALEPLWALKLDWQDYPEEPVPNDGSILHALERMIPLIVNRAGFAHAVTHVPGVTR